MADKKVKFIVRGLGRFPFDMLRYDMCYPYESGDALKMETPENREDRRTPREITLIGPRHPTDARWESFLWKVVSTETLR